MKRNRIVNFAVIVCIFMSLASEMDAHATNWYVDNTASGSNNGTSWVDAWNAFSCITWGTGGVVAGDTLYISGGSTSKTYTENWSVGASGKSGSPITITVDASNPSHNGKVIFDYDHLGDSSATINAVNLGSNDYITIIGNVDGKQHIVFQNLRHIKNSNVAAAIGGSGSTNIKVSYIQVINCNSGVWLTYSTSSEVSYSDIQVRGEAAVRLVASAGEWDANIVHHNTIELLFNIEEPPGWTGAAYTGPDGIVCGHGVSIFNNTVTVTKTTEYTSPQHPDIFVADGNYIKIYNNETINVGDSVLHFTRWSNTASHDYLIYNNVFRIIEGIDTTSPEFFRLYTGSGYPIVSVTNLRIFNNTFIDNTVKGQNPIKFAGYYGNPTFTNIEIKNNIFYNCGYNSAIIYIEDSTNFTDTSFIFANNVYYNDAGTQYISYRGTLYTMEEWLSAGIESNPSLSKPIVVSYTPQNVYNDLHLAPTDNVALGTGEDLSKYFTTNKDGISRMLGAWDRGALGLPTFRLTAPQNFVEQP